jgi:hypothetical protein
MPSVTIRDVSPTTHAKLAARAALKGQSLQEYVNAKLDEIADRLEPDEWVERVRTRKATMKSSLTVEKILEYKDLDRH